MAPFRPERPASPTSGHTGSSPDACARRAGSRPRPGRWTASWRSRDRDGLRGLEFVLRGQHRGVHIDRGVHIAGVDPSHVHPVGLELHAQGFGRATHRELAGAVGAVPVDAQDAGERGDHHDGTGASVDPTGDHGPGRPERAKVVDVHMPGELLVGQPPEAARGDDAGARDQQVARPLGTLGLGDGCVHHLPIGNVHSCGADEGRGWVCRESCEVCVVQGEDAHPVALCRSGPTRRESAWSGA